MPDADLLGDDLVAVIWDGNSILVTSINISSSSSVSELSLWGISIRVGVMMQTFGDLAGVSVSFIFSKADVTECAWLLWLEQRHGRRRRKRRTDPRAGCQLTEIDTAVFCVFGFWISKCIIQVIFRFSKLKKSSNCWTSSKKWDSMSTVRCNCPTLSKIINHLPIDIQTELASKLLKSQHVT